ncbi:MAG: DUF4292 domain-containing protein [Candidatus Cloacimonadota bacterium]|nr:MAG: DUF4292 domain-containing protein [Candidatus Cloacimonadota bacterium]
MTKKSVDVSGGLMSYVSCLRSESKVNIRMLSSIILLLLCLTGCAKRGMVVKYPKENYEAFLEAYTSQYKIDSLTGNGSFEIKRLNDELFGNFSIFYSDKQKRWGITLYGLFGMILSQIEVKNDSFNIFSPLLDKPIKGLLKDLNIEDYIGISINPTSIPLLTTGQVPVDTKRIPSYCEKKNDNFIEFSFEDENMNSKIGWSSREKRIEYYICKKTGGKDYLKVKFSDFRNINTSSLPHSIIFIYKGKEEAYLKLKYKYMEVNQKPEIRPKTSD